MGGVSSPSPGSWRSSESAILAAFGFIQTDAVQAVFLAIGLVSAASAVALLAGFATGTPVLPPLERRPAWLRPIHRQRRPPGSAGS